jgi:hypothetical protein
MAKKGFKTNFNRKVRNAKKHYDENGVKIADSTWELSCKNTLLLHGIKFDFQKKFDLIPTIKRNWLKRTLAKRTWTPDFVFEDLKIVADAKGFITDMARIKIQLFAWLYPDWEVFLIKNKNDLQELLKKVKPLDKPIK